MTAVDKTNRFGPYSGYYRDPEAEPDRFLTSVTRGTPGGEFLRRYWMPVAYERELGKVPLRVRALGEELVVFRDLQGRTGCLQLHCSHRNASLEFGILTGAGIRCCYHGREFAVDGTCVAIPNDPNEERLKPRATQGSYPTHVFAGIVFAYMGPPDAVPVFPLFDRFDLPGIRIEPGARRLDLDCNWLQMKENTMDPIHTAVLHVIPQMRGTQAQFANEFANNPEFTWWETAGGCIYLGARAVEDKVWVRSGEILFPHVHTISSILETGRDEKYASAPFMTFWTLPIDDAHSVQFYLSHIAAGETMPLAKRREIEVFGQYHDDRPYEERQWVPGDVDAQESQGPINVHRSEHLGTLDQGVSLFRKQLRRGIEAVQSGERPMGFYLSPSEVPPTYANDFVAPAGTLGVDPNDRASLRRATATVWAKYQERPPMTAFRER